MFHGFFFQCADMFVYLVLVLAEYAVAQNVSGIFNDISSAYEAVSSRTDSEHNILTGQQFDFIIIGSGSAGSVLANRLSENPKWNVLLLEAGKQPAVIVDVPALASLFQFTDYNWGYLMEKQDNMCLGLKDQRMSWPRGKALGGTTIINYMIHIRGNRVDFDRWAEAGNKGWSFDELLPYFKKSEDYLVKLQDEGYHQRGGYVGVQDVPVRSTSSHAFLRAMQEYGYPIVDYNGRQQLGASYVHATLRNGRRSSALSAFLDTSRHRPNLKILTRARVTKILIDPLSKRAHGVEFVRNRKYFVAKASKEVVLSAGALNSPQVLMLSGIGPQPHLDSLKIPVVQNLPVGRKLYDHLTFLGLTFTVNESIVLQQSSLTAPDSLINFVLSGTGPLTTLGGVEALAFLRTPLSKDAVPDYPDVELIFVGGGMQTDRGDFYRKSLRVSDRVYDAMWKPLESKYAFSVLPMLYHPRSFGFVELKSKNPFHWPKFHGNFFTDVENFDVKTFIASIREVQKIVEMPAFRKYDARQVRTPVPGCEFHAFDSDDYWECALRHLTATLHHQVATCKMGPSADPEAVVDDRLNVHGVKGLKVADTSVIPTPISAHTNVPAYMIGEKAADMIKEDWTNSLR